MCCFFLRNMRRNNALLVKDLCSLIGKYNILAEERGMQKIPYPSYGKVINNISRRLLLRDLKTISDAITKIEEIPIEKEETEKPLKIARDVVFTAGMVSEVSTSEAWKDGLWYYIKRGEDISVYADTEAIKERMGDGTELVLGYADMPYEVLVDIDGKEWKVNKYALNIEYDDENPLTFGLFGFRDVGEGHNDWNDNVIKKLTSLTLQSWMNRNVTDMAFMFNRCIALTTLNLNSFNTSAVENMHRMFYSSIALQSLSLGDNFNTSKATDMSEMFSYCTALTTLDLSSFNTSNVTNMHGMFSGCGKLTTPDLSSFNTSNVTDMYSMFAYCTALTTLNLNSFNTSNVTDMRGMFEKCGKLTTLDLSGFNTSNVTDMSGMFSYCVALTTLTLGANFTVPSDYYTKTTRLNPDNSCTIFMNETMYNAFKVNDLKNYTFSPNTWDASAGTVQEITVTPPV